MSDTFIFITSVLTSIVLFILLILGITWLTRDTDLELLNSGLITEQQYCQKKQDLRQPPARCYKYFGVKPVGEINKYNPATKTNTRETILIPNE